jgi:transcriptional regulator with XRE-family HTH domain
MALTMVDVINRKTVAENIKGLRYRLGMTQVAFAETLGIKRSSLGAYEEGRCFPSYEVLKRVTELTETTQEEILYRPLFDGTTRPTQPRPAQRGKRPFNGQIRIYSLSDEKGDVFYIGCTTYSVASRMKKHISNSRAGRGGKCGEKIRSLKFRISATVVNVTPVSGASLTETLLQARIIEREYISKYETLGYHLTNSEVRTVKGFDDAREVEGYTISNF